MARKTEPKVDEAAVFVARSSGLIRIKGVPYRYLRNQTHIPAGHPLLDVIPNRFAPLRVEGVQTPPEVVAAPAPVIPEIVVETVAEPEIVTQTIAPDWKTRAGFSKAADKSAKD